MRCGLPALVAVAVLAGVPAAGAKGGRPIAFVAVGGARRVVAVDVSARRVIRSACVPAPHNIAWDGMSVVVTSPSAGRVTVLDPRTLRIRRVFTGLGFPHDVEARGRLAFVTDEASWCIPCRDEAPLLNASARAHRGKVVFLGVNVQDLSEDALKFLREFDVPYASVRDRNNKIFEDYGLTGVPETYYLDARGRIVGHVPGAVSRRTLEQGGADQVLSGGRR